MASTPLLRHMSTEKGKTVVMGILNVTPDSFSDGGKYFNPLRAIEHALELQAEGANVIDVGAESTRPSAVQLTPEEEIERLKPILSELRQVLTVPISVDTYHAKTAAFAIEQGADIINDIWGGLADPDILQVAAEADCDYIYMHNRSAPAEGAALATLLEETKLAINSCMEAGIAPGRLWLDPGVGFGKTYEHNLEVLNHLDEYCQLGYPVLLGTSRKSVIGKTLNTAVDERLEGSLATVSIGVLKGVQAVRVHDVEATVRTCRMVEAIRNAN